MKPIFARRLNSVLPVNLSIGLLAVTLLFVIPRSVRAANITFQGSLLRDDDIRVFTIVAEEQTSVRIRSVGYAGDPYSDLGPITSGGFDTYLTVFDSTGAFVGENDDGDDSIVDPSTGQALDADLTLTLDQGVYSLWLTQYGNYSLGPNDSFGFSQNGNAMYTTDPNFNPGIPCASGFFKDSSGSNGACRTGNYSLEFLNDQGAYAYYALVASSGGAPPVPEPGTGSAFICGVATIILVTSGRGMNWIKHQT